ncbi:MAG: CsbD family protein [Candidatus Viridilinea halotolerans]|uniref:CsbD family protein n=1 Tax=Candidatus Viridilinea halotolerans TaxID=2491704 RepID=A0A426TXA4_9CHLR|nr:MAG: CsbD family protein [Candidatus Viridilinea halotolerans]
MTMGSERTKGKAEEIKGSVKQGVGDMIGNEQMEAEGYVEKSEGQFRQEKVKAEEQAKGAREETEGKVEGFVGRITGDEETQVEGKAKEHKGKGRQKAND